MHGKRFQIVKAKWAYDKFVHRRSYLPMPALVKCLIRMYTVQVRGDFLLESSTYGGMK